MNGRVIKFRDILAVQIEALPLPSLSPPSSPMAMQETSLLHSPSPPPSSSSHGVIYSLSRIQAAGEKLKFVFKTSEDNIILESSYDIISAKSWLQVVQQVIEFIQIPAPPRSNSTCSVTVPTGAAGIPAAKVTPLSTTSSHKSQSPGVISVTPVRLTKEFTANSAAVFASSTDTMYILHHLCSSLSSSYPILNDLRDILVDVWKLLSDIRYNREAITLFGERLEMIIRLLGDESSSNSSGILFIAGKNFNRLILSSLTRFHSKLHEIEGYLVPMTNSGWLSHSLLKHSSSSQTMRAKLQYYDNDFTSTFNQLYKSIIKATAISPQNLNMVSAKQKDMVIPAVVYDMASDLKRSIDAFGGIKTINQEKAKIRALSRLIQCDASDLQSELQIILNDPKHASLITKSSSSSGGSTTINRSNSRLSNDSLASQKVINFDSSSSSSATSGESMISRIFGGGNSVAKPKKMSEGSYHKFEDESIHYPSIYNINDNENFTSPSSHGLSAASKQRRGYKSSSASSSSSMTAYGAILQYVCCCLVSANTAGDDHSLLSSDHPTSSTTPENGKYVVKKIKGQSPVKETMSRGAEEQRNQQQPMAAESLHYDIYRQQDDRDFTQSNPLSQ
jgi:hypothetical protein